MSDSFSQKVQFSNNNPTKTKVSKIRKEYDSETKRNNNQVNDSGVHFMSEIAKQNNYMVVQAKPNRRLNVANSI